MLESEGQAVWRRVPEQILSEQTVRDRFHYRKPGPVVATVDVFVRASPHWLAEQPRMRVVEPGAAGDGAFDTEGLTPVSRSEAASET